VSAEYIPTRIVVALVGFFGVDFQLGLLHYGSRVMDSGLRSVDFGLRFVDFG
jgi:hypothetical protein